VEKAWRSGIGRILLQSMVHRRQSIWIAEHSDKWSRAELPDAIVRLTASRERPIVTFADKSPYKWDFEIDMLGGGIQKNR